MKTAIRIGVRSVLAGLVFMAAGATAQTYRSPAAIAAPADGHEWYVAEYTANAVAVVDPASGTVTRRIALPDAPGGLALSPDGATLYVTAAVPAGCVRVLDAASGNVRATMAVGHTPVSPVLSADGGRLYVCNRFTNDISVIDTAAAAETARIAVPGEPVAAALTPDGARLLVAHLLPTGASDGAFTAASVSVIDTTSNQVAANITLPNGSTGLHGICVSPDGRFAYVTHLLARYQLPTTQLERGWMNTNALSVIDVAELKPVNTVLLDDVDLGAANPWAVACTPDGKSVCVTHAGTHELSVIDRAGLHAKLDRAAAGERVTEVTSRAQDVPNDLSFLLDTRRRIKLAGNGPRALFLTDATAVTAEHFSDSLSVVDILNTVRADVRAIALAEPAEQTPVRKGEIFFNDAALCFQHWQSCASCHPDARVDGLNWDLLNDGIGNPKNTKSMLLSHQTPPAMSLGIRDKAETAVRAGIRFIQFAERPEEDAQAIDSYLKSLTPVPSPRLENGALRPEAERGRAIFERAGCAACHMAPLYTDLEPYDVGTVQGMDAGKPVDTPTLVEIWRTAPYLHDGRAATLRDVFVRYNPDDKHGKTSGLTAEEMGDLIAFMLSL